MKSTIISLSGYGYSGSGAVRDLLKEFNGFGLVKFEFQILYFPDGISDLDYKLNASCVRFYDSDLAIVRFLDLCKKLELDYVDLFQGHLYEIANEYITKIVQLKWESFWAYDRLGCGRNYYNKIESINTKRYKRNIFVHQLNRLLRKVHLQGIKELSYIEPFKKRSMYLSIKPNNFLEATQNFMDALLSYIPNDFQYVVLDQFLPPHNPSNYYKYINHPVKSIVISRDPRDTWIFAKLKKVSFIPHDDLNNFIVWYKENNKKEITIEHENVLRLNFEDLIYKYEETIERLKTFLSCDQHSDRKKYFRPEDSINNTQLVLKYPEFIEDVKIIEEKLPEFLYDFKQYKMKPNFKTEIF